MESGTVSRYSVLQWFGSTRGDAKLRCSAVGLLAAVDVDIRDEQPKRDCPVEKMEAPG